LLFLGEHGFQRLVPVAEYLPHFFVHKQFSCDPSKNGFAYVIMQKVGHEDTSFDGFKVMFVVPDFIGSLALIIDEELFIPDMGNLSHPVQSDVHHWFDAISDN
jgi:hypothetical protein